MTTPSEGGPTPLPTPLKPGESPEEIAKAVGRKYRHGQWDLESLIVDALQAYAERRGEEERAKALEEAAQLVVRWRGTERWGYIELAEHIRALLPVAAAAPSGDAALTDGQIAEARKEELERWRSRYGDSEDALHKARMLLGWIVENEEIAFSDHYDATRDEWPLNDNRATLLREWDKKMAEAKAMAPSGDAKGTR